MPEEAEYLCPSLAAAITRIFKPLLPHWLSDLTLQCNWLTDRALPSLILDELWMRSAPTRRPSIASRLRRSAPLLSRSRFSKPSFICSRQPSTWRDWRRTRIVDRPPQGTAVWISDNVQFGMRLLLRNFYLDRFRMPAPGALRISPPRSIVPKRGRRLGRGSTTPLVGAFHRQRRISRNVGNSV